MIDTLSNIGSVPHVETILLWLVGVIVLAVLMAGALLILSSNRYRKCSTCPNQRTTKCATCQEY